MKKIIFYMLSIMFISTSFFVLSNTFGQFELGNTNTILNTDPNAAINTDLWWWTIWDPIRQWAYQVVKSDDGNYTIDGIVDNDSEITKHSTALNRAFWIIKNIINRALWLLSLVALIYLLIHWFMIVTAAWDEAKYKKWLKWITNAAIAIWWIWLSWFIVSFIFRVITNIADI